jgi:DUF2075 family protein/DNA replication protein DnaC/SOS-response transcriptional repressor LexA
MKQEFDLTIDISEYDFSKDSLPKISDNQWVKNQWPLVYFIQNEKKRLAYVGESTNGLSRINNHLSNELRSVLNKVSIIGCDKFNKSATLDIESQLIQYIPSEGTFTLQNGNNGLSHHNYYQRSLYGNLFKEVWRQLREKKIVNKSLEEIQNTNFFKYSPYKSLNQDQFNSVLEIIENLNKKAVNHIFIKGSAGTGKTILATYLIKLLNSKYEELNTVDLDYENYQEVELLAKFRKNYSNPSIGLVIAMSSLRKTLQDVFDKIPGLHSSMVISPTDTFKKKYDILIVDEAHRLRQRRNISFMGLFTKNNNRLGLDNNGTELDWIIANSKHQIFFYDAAQSVKPSDVPQSKYEALLNKPSTVKLELKSQMRINAGSDYITFVDNLLNCRLDETDIKFEPLNYELRVFESFKELHSELTKKEDEFKLCRLIAGYAWPWVSRNDNPEQDYDIEIEGLKFTWNKTDKDWISTKNSFREIGCIHTTQGYDLNYVGVIFGKEIIYNPLLKRIEIISKNYFDRNGKAGITNHEDLKAFIINIYKTIMYRGIKGTYIYACDENLRKYLQDSITGKKVKPELNILSIDKAKPYLNCVPLYDISAAAGSFSDLQQSSDNEWVELPKPYKAKRDYFVCKVVGESMNKVIPSGSWCLFKRDTGGSREGKIVLVQHYTIQDSDFGAGYTVKSYHSEKQINKDTWTHKAIILKPLSYDSSYEDLVFSEDVSAELKVIGIFEGVIA